jgi:hypothetical protein
MTLVHTDCRPVIGGRSVMLPDGDRRPERRSNHGQMILRVFCAGHEALADLLLRGAPLRNRTVDLLLTMGHSNHSLTWYNALGRADLGTHRARSGAQSQSEGPLDGIVTLTAPTPERASDPRCLTVAEGRSLGISSIVQPGR